MNKIKKKQKIVGTIVGLFIVIGIFFTWFTNIGYIITVPIRGYKQVKENIYIDKDFTGNVSNVLAIIDEAHTRLTNFWGDTESKPIIIISNNQDELKKLGWAGSPALTTTIIFFGAHNYVVISPNGLNVDVTAHELTHAELHDRLYNGKILPQRLAPVWFDEGVALQNDYRENYNYDAWKRVTNDGNNITDFSKIETERQFHDSNIDVRRYNYIISKHEVGEWIKTHSVEELIVLINAINKGKSFNELYFAK